MKEHPVEKRKKKHKIKIFN